LAGPHFGRLFSKLIWSPCSRLGSWLICCSKSDFFRRFVTMPKSRLLPSFKMSIKLLKRSKKLLEMSKNTEKVVKILKMSKKWRCMSKFFCSLLTAHAELDSSS
jgi:hypothetical protein